MFSLFLLVEYATKYPYIHNCVYESDSKLTRVHSVHGKDKPVHYSCALALCSSALRDLAVPVGDGLSTEGVCEVWQESSGATV